MRARLHNYFDHTRETAMSWDDRIVRTEETGGAL